MIYTESELKSVKFEISASVRIRGKKRVTESVKFKMSDITAREFDDLYKLLNKFNKSKSRKQA